MTAEFDSTVSTMFDSIAATLDRATFIRLVEEGQSLRRQFDAATKSAKILTADDLKFRCRSR